MSSKQQQTGGGRYGNNYSNMADKQYIFFTLTLYICEVMCYAYLQSGDREIGLMCLQNMFDNILVKIIKYRVTITNYY